MAGRVNGRIIHCILVHMGTVVVRSALILLDKTSVPCYITIQTLVSEANPISGYLKSEYRTCGKADCSCRRDKAKRHGPYWVVVWWEHGRKRRQHVPHDRVAALRAQLEYEQTMRQEMRALRAIMVEMRDTLAQRRGAAPSPPTPPAPAPAVPPTPATAEGMQETIERSAAVWQRLLNSATGG
jgi:hypothetical protein